MSSRLVISLLGAAVISFAASADAAIYHADFFLDGLQEDPPVATPGSGIGMATFDTATGQLDVSGTFQDLIGTTNNAHVHGYAPAGTGAGVVFGISYTPGATSGVFSGSGNIPSGNIQDVLNGLTYVNIHTTFRPGGEIRGQITAWVPEPATASMLALGLLGLGALCRRSPRF